MDKNSSAVQRTNWDRILTSTVVARSLNSPVVAQLIVPDPHSWK